MYFVSLHHQLRVRAEVSFEAAGEIGGGRGGGRIQEP